MAIVDIEEFAASGFITGPVPVGVQPSNTTQRVTTSASSQQTSAFQANTNMVRLHTDGIIAYKFGTNPTVVAATDARMSANVTEYHAVTPGLKVALITST